MKKTEVAVKLTKKNCKKVLGILEMFGERIWKHSRLKEGRDGYYPVFAMMQDGEWLVNLVDTGKALVKPRELRNILAKEHLKAGDIVVVSNPKNKKGWVIKLDGGENFSHSISFRLSTGFLNECSDTIGYLPNFLRYATNKEKAFLEPKSEFGVDEFEEGEWYKSNIGSVINYQEDGKSYGFYGYDWFETGASPEDYKTEWRKATEAEVVEALKKECAKRYGEDWENVKIKSHADEGCESSVNNGSVSPLINTITVWNKNGMVYYKGKWAEPLPENVTVTKEVWVNVYSVGQPAIHFDEDSALTHRYANGQTVKGTLTYQIEK